MAPGRQPPDGDGGIDAATRYIFHHVFLPPKLPQEDDFDENAEAKLLSKTIRALTAFKFSMPPQSRDDIQKALDMLENTAAGNSQGISDTTLQTLLQDVVTRGRALALHIRAQNAGVLVTADHKGRIRFDLFELSPQNHAVNTTRGRLQRTFPGASLTLPTCKVQDENFREAVAQILSSLDSQSVSGMQPTARKSGRDQVEARDTVNPAMITEIFAGFLSAHGEPAATPEIHKCTREEVLWKSARSPWRRSPRWLLIRVALQLLMGRATGSDNLYKQAMLFIEASMLQAVIAKLGGDSATLMKQDPFSRDMLHAMATKIGRRLLKLGNEVEKSVVLFVSEVTERASLNLERAWAEVRAHDARSIDLQLLQDLDFERDAEVKIPLLATFIGSIGKRTSDSTRTTFMPKSGLVNLSPDALPQLRTNDKFAIPNLLIFESWVNEHSHTWMTIHLDEANICQRLLDLMESYHDLALKYYDSNPELLSVMHLTMAELWSVLDTAALHRLPMLRSYPPGFNYDSLQNLLLTTKSQMERLADVERYLDTRRTNATFQWSRLYLDIESASSFAARYFGQDPRLQEKLQALTNAAQEARIKKVADFKRLKKTHEDLIQYHATHECEYYEEVVRNRRNTWKETRHDPGCKKCAAKTRAGQLDITIHEWPLPTDAIKIRAIVFELLMPETFAASRDADVFMSQTVLKMKTLTLSDTGNAKLLASDPHLQHVTRATKSRITLVSPQKANVQSHYNRIEISSASENQVCLPNGFNYKYYDTTTSTLVGARGNTDTVARSLMYRLPQQSKALQKYLLRPSESPDGPSHNKVIAGQSECPHHMVLEEYVRLCTVPLGHCIQWLNMLTELSSPSVDYKKEETALFFLQCMYQAGPPRQGTCHRAAHLFLADEQSGLELLDSLKVAFLRVKENWESAQALSVFAAVACRLLPLTKSDKVEHECIIFLDTLRTTAFLWVQQLRTKAQQASTGSDRAEFRTKSAGVALICALCADVEPQFLARILRQCEAASTFIQCCVVVQECSASRGSFLQLLRHRFSRLLYRSISVLHSNVKGINAAIQGSWSAYRPGYGWQATKGGSGHWIRSQTGVEGQNEPLAVHYNLLSGELLVNGLTLGQPGDEYQQHTLWRTLFGQAVIEVMPSNVPGMPCSIKTKHHGYVVHFGLQKSGSVTDLLLRASSPSTVYELLPPRFFSGKFPESFIKDFVHWYDIARDAVEFRSVSEPWGRAVWVMRHVSTSSWRLEKDGSCVVGLEAATAKQIAHVFAPLVDGPSIHCVLQRSGDQIEIELPTLQLSFFLHHGQSSLRSREFRGMSVDQDQSLDTLVGFENKLLLRHDTGPQRAVLVLEGAVAHEVSPGHVLVRAVKQGETRVHHLSVDRQLGRLVDNGSLQVKLFLAYIHALTASVLPDPLLGFSGTEQALNILKSSTVRSFEELAQANTAMLCRIAGLSPGRVYYPTHLQEMQTVSWDANLSFYCQHNGFSACVSSILDQAESATILHQDSKWRRPQLAQVDVHLMQRDAIRASTFRVCGFGAEDHSRLLDKSYRGRDIAQSSEKASYAHVMSTLAGSTQGVRHYSGPTAEHLWSLVSGLDALEGPEKAARTRTQLFDSNAASLVNHGFDIRSLLALFKAFGSTPATSITSPQLKTWLSFLAARSNPDTTILQTFALFHTVTALRNIKVPVFDTCRPAEGHEVTMQGINNIIQSHLVPLESSPEGDLEAVAKEKPSAFEARQRKLFKEKQNTAAQALANGLFAQRTSASPSMPDLQHARVDVGKYIRLDAALAASKKKFQVWYDNRQLLQYFQRIEQVANCVNAGIIGTPQWPRRKEMSVSRRRQGFMSKQILFSCPAPGLPSLVASLPSLSLDTLAKSSTSRLGPLVDRLRKLCNSGYEMRYTDELEASRNSLTDCTGDQMVLDGTFSTHTATEYLDSCRDHAGKLYECIVAHFDTAPLEAPRFMNSSILRNSRQWPRVSATFLLQQLQHGIREQLSNDWKATLVQYGRAVVEVHRAERISKAVYANKREDLLSELRHVPHTNWDPCEHPDWLLLEVEAGITIREVQVEIAKEMMAPEAQQNAVMQLNMGEGKSSVIVPMVASALADTTQLVRVLVAKAQSKQMQHTLCSKLGGLLNRRVYFMPFSRSLKLDARAVCSVEAMMRECMADGGVVLLQPESILSFKLMCLETTNARNQTVALPLLRIQGFFDTVARDIVDESDEIFSPKWELIYTMGQQSSVELSTRRWGCIQQVLELVRTLSLDISKLPQFLEYNHVVEGSFPRIRLLQQEAKDLLVARVADHVCENGLDGFPISRQDEAIRNAVKTYITKPDLDSDEIAQVEREDNQGFFQESVRGILLLLRGLLAGGIIGFVFQQKRWRVNYGLVPSDTPRTKLAVPYTSKDQPSARSEFSHPDVVIMLTSLSYYYGGLTDADLYITLSHVMDSDQAGAEYSLWLQDAPNMPHELRQLEGINLRDRQQCEEVLFPNLRYGKCVIDYFLSHFVFPKEMKEFPSKLSSSGWDIGQSKGKSTTGFSGTNDSRSLLPLDVQQLDLPAQRHTNALVLEYLLRPENAVVTMPKRSDYSVSDADFLLSTTLQQDPPIRVILDAGAQILELNNLQVASRWLELEESLEIRAVVFVDDKDEVSVLDRKGRVEPLRASPFAVQLDVCLVFLDEAHTRGIDLRLPQDYRAAVTLGPASPKDKVVQACMRMRQLGKGQSVAFCVNEDIESKIRSYSRKSSNKVLDVEDVILWAISETFEMTRKMMPLWAVQGKRFLCQRALWLAVRSKGITTMLKAQADAFVEDEAQSLNHRYRPRSRRDGILQILPDSDGTLVDIKQRCEEFEGLQLNASMLQEEQERELAPEVEQEHQVQRPRAAQPAPSLLHPDVLQFMSKGELPSKPEGYKPAFASLLRTSARVDLEACQLQYDREAFLVSQDFARTVAGSAKKDGNLDSYQRPVQWILSRRTPATNTVDTIMVVSPFEAQRFMEKTMASEQDEQTTLHVYKARTNASYAPLDSLSLLTWPRRDPPPKIEQRLIDLLNLFAGQLYFATIGDYHRVCRSVDLATGPPIGQEKHDPDGFIRRDASGKLAQRGSPVKFLQTLTSTIRRNGTGISRTHMGKVLDGRLLMASDFVGQGGQDKDRGVTVQ
ncbi:uncharacterized protein LTR77_009059 [Saxophila tyrrhenica]|uniref:ubiquitinyl hydrolase 1 n=1 Tax=Saxophila tyrrhenica TaxID=1690608 RepID=A0AAV9NZN1_9PEZI|nr:hypothetical protein LTR77_009059 [Saxophila tyrrhenica]